MQRKRYSGKTRCACSGFDEEWFEMSVKDDIADILEQNRGSYVSGQELAGRLGCTRGAVWKAVRALQQQGFGITAATNKGYCLDPDSDVLNENGVRKYLDESCKGMQISVYPSVGSTNDVVKELAAKGAPEGTVAVAAQQTGGKGRLGRSFFSPEGTGLYLSILLRPDIEVARAVRITTCAALAVCEAIEKHTSEKPCIKWVNDVYIRGRKVCGILTEASLSMENGGVDYAVLGIGVNVYEPSGGFPEQIRDIAGAVTQHKSADLKNRLAGSIISGFMRFYRDISSGSFREDYSRRLMWKGEDIVAISGREKTRCRLIDVDDECRLVVQLPGGEKKLISSGEISIRKI